MIKMDETRFKNKAYEAMIEELERLEHKGAYRGNGHHLAQRLASMLWDKFSDANLTVAERERIDELALGYETQ